MQILVKTLTGKKQNFNFEPENTVLQVSDIADYGVVLRDGD